MKKWLVGGIVAGMVAVGGIGAVWASETAPVPANGPSFEQMLPYMEKMHPRTDKETLKNMYNACHAGGGMMGGKGTSNMMGNQGMMKGL